MTPEVLARLTNKVIQSLDKAEIPCVEQIQDVVERTLIMDKFASTAKAYILYRAEHAKIRQSEACLLYTSGFCKPVNCLAWKGSFHIVDDSTFGNDISTGETK